MNKQAQKEFKIFLIFLIKNKKYIKINNYSGRIEVSYKNDQLVQAVDFHYTDGLILKYMNLYPRVKNSYSILIDVFDKKLTSLNWINIRLNWTLIKLIKEIKNHELNTESITINNSITNMIPPEYKRLTKVKKLLKNG